MKFLCKYSWATGEHGELTIPWAFHGEAARILAMVQARKKHPNNKGILVTEIIPQKTTVDDMLKNFDL